MNTFGDSGPLAKPAVRKNDPRKFLASAAGGGQAAVMNWVFFFDGDCAFCSRSARLCARLDKRHRLELAPLQGETGKRLGISHHAEGEAGTMVVLRERDGKIFLRSDGLLELARALGGWWRLFGIFRLVPRPLREGVYRWIARNRHRLLGESQSCLLDDPAVRERLRQ